MPIHPHPDQIARCVVQAFDALPAKFKPRTLSDGKREWVPLAGVVLSHKVKDHCKASSGASSIHPVSTRDGIARERNDDCNDSSSNVLTCAALATGMKCLPHSKLPLAQGAVLHDSHAEILALRAFNRFLLDECLALARKTTDLSANYCYESPWIRWRTTPNSVLAAHAHPVTNDPSASPLPPFELHDDIGIHMFCSELPCGDASMELTMSEQADATPWPTSNARSPSSPPSTLSPALQNPPSDDAARATTMSPPPSSSLPPPPLPPPSSLQQQQQQQQLLGRGHFDRLGIVRRKPSRPDAPLALSKSCSDKLALKQCTGLLSALLSLLVRPDRCFLDTLVVPETGYVPAAMERAFGPEGRMRAVLGQCGEDSVGEDKQEDGGRKGWRKKEEEEEEEEEEEGKPGFRPRAFRVRTTKVEFAAAKRVVRDGDIGEPVPSNLSAVCTPHRREVLINGVRQGRKQSDLKGASCVSRRAMWADVAAVASMVGPSGLADAVDGRKTYGEVKACQMLEERERLKAEVRSAALKGWTRNSGDEWWSLEEED